jgi:3-oxoacyl-(acyl-carrier-protein) synthase
MLHHLSNNAHALLSIDIGARGDGTTTGGANAGAQALEAAIAALDTRAIDAALVFSYDSLVEPETVLSLGAGGVAAPVGLEALAPAYEVAACGIVPGEAAAAVVLERSGDAGSRAHATLWAATAADGSDGWPEAITLGRALSEVAGGDTVIDGAAIALPDRDAAERRVIAEILGDRASLTAISSMLGQVGAPMPLVQVIALSRLLARGKLPPIARASNVSMGPLQPTTECRDTAARSAVGLSAGVPGLAAAVRVEVR